MAMLQVYCKDCGNETSIRGQLEREDLKGTKYEDRIDTITDDELWELQRTEKVKDPWGKWYDISFFPPIDTLKANKILIISPIIKHKIQKF